MQQCDTIERLKQHLLASSSSSSDLDQDGSSSDSGDEAIQKLREMRQRLEAKLDQEMEKHTVDTTFKPKQNPERIGKQGFTNEAVDLDSMLLPDWLNGVENFAEVVKDNADTILNALTSDDKARLCELLPSNDQDTLLVNLLKGGGPI